MKKLLINKRYSRAYTLIELALVVIMVGLVYGMVAPAARYYIDKAKETVIENVIEDMAESIDDYFNLNGQYPDSLVDVFGEIPLDEWGNPYQYLRINGGPKKGKGKLRKDKNLVPINSDYDLYSMGPDGKSASPLTASISKDDIVRGRNGTFFGVAADF
jgi:general secretion pathway protein G